MCAQPNQAGNPDSASLLDRTIPWFWFVGAVVASIFLHELGHCSVAWLHGYPAIPTPAKEYILRPLSEAAQYQVALGGIFGSVLALFVAGFCRYRYLTPTFSAIFAGAMLPPGFYTLRFILAGPGHDATEFQEAQAALGLPYAGHSADWFFLGLFVAAAAFWFLLTRPRLTPRQLGRLFAGAFAGLLVLILLQSVNNIIFDRLFESGPIQNTKP
jgi:hypothetical protein